MSSRNTIVALALVLGLGGAYAADHYGLIPRGEDSSEGGAGGPRTPRPMPTGGGGMVDELGSPAELIPADAFVYIQLASIDSFEDLMEIVAARMDPMLAGAITPDAMLGQMLQMVGGDASMVDRNRPVGIAMAMPEDGMQPTPTLILPVGDPALFARSLTLAPGNALPEVREHYVGISLSPDYRPMPAPNDMSRDLPDTGFAMRIRMEPIMPMLRPGMQQAQAQARKAAEASGVSMAGYTAGVDFSMSMVESLEILDLGFEMQGEQVDIRFGMQFAEGSQMALEPTTGAASLAELAGYLSQEDTFSMVAAWDRDFLRQTVTPMLDQVLSFAESDEERASFEAIAKVLNMAPMFGHQVALSGHIEVGHTRSAFFFHPEAPDALFQAFPVALEGLDLESAGMVVSALEEVEFEGGRRAHLTLSLAAGDGDPVQQRQREAFGLLWGGTDIELVLASKDGHMAVLIGGDDEWRDAHLARLGHPGTAPGGPLGEALRNVENDAVCMVYQVDMLGVMSGTLQLMAEHMGLDPSQDLATLRERAGADTLPITVFAGIQGTRWTGGMSVDWNRFMDLMGATQ